MDVEVDVAVVGGGPAGASAACFLARSGRSVVVVERSDFPRDKPCGDGLTPRSIRMLDRMGLGGHVRGWQRVSGLRVVTEDRVRTVLLPGASSWCRYGSVVTRRELDKVVLDNAESAGAVVRYGSEAVRPVMDGGRVSGVVATRAGREEVLRARWLVCADGATGTMRRQLGRTHDRRHPMVLALRQYCVAGPEPLEWFHVQVDLREPWGLLPGYGWAFPVGDGQVNVGVGVIHDGQDRPRVSLHDHLDRLVHRLAHQGIVDPRHPGRARRGGRLLMGGAVWPPHGPGYVLVGDSAGMVNPFTGEGIAYAYETGWRAARHVHAAIERGDGDLASFGRELAKTYGAYYRLGRGMATTARDPARMEQLVRRATATDRRLRFASTLLLDHRDDPQWSFDQMGMRGLVSLAQLLRWDPTLELPRRG